MKPSGGIMYKKEFELVEKVLDLYPEEWSRNYYQNKQTLIIKDKTNEECIIKSINGQYDEDDNVIEIFDHKSISHELFHTSFRDEEKTNKKLDKLEDLLISNGVAYKKITEERICYSGRALTEGFVEYLNRKITNSKSHSFEYFIVDLLISIYGEEILKYPLTNDPYGFYTDTRFYNIIQLRLALDQYYYCVKFIWNVNYLIEPIFEQLTQQEQQDIWLEIDKNITNFYNSVIGSIEAIINEYKNCAKPLITKNDLINKLKKFIIDPDYKVNFEFPKAKNYDVEKELQKIIKAI